MFIFKEGRLQFPDRFLRIDKRIEKALMETLEPKEGDVIVIGTAQNALEAETGARAAARTMRKKPL